MRALITGITGFVGSHLAKCLLSEGVEVWGTAYNEDINRFITFDNLNEIKDKINFIQCSDISIKDSVSEVIKTSEPDYIFHLVNQKKAFVPTIFPVDMFDVNVIGTVNVFEAIRELNIHPAIMLAGCGEEYGCPPMVESPDDQTGFLGSELNRTIRINHVPKKVLKLPVTEDFSLNPLSIYGVSKAAQDMLGYAYHKEYGMKIVRTRAFDITGPRDESSVASDIARQIVEIERGKSTELKVGSRDIKKDFTDVRDVVRAYWLAATRGKPGEAYNICSGKARSVQSVIDALRMQSIAQFEIIQDNTMMKASDIPVLEGDHRKFTKQTGWKPEIGFAQTMGDLLDYWRKKS